MSAKRSSIAIASAVLIALGSVSTQANAVEKTASMPTKPFKEQNIGTASGTLIGALIGGPFGAGVGFVVGNIVGMGAGQLRQAKQEASTAKKELAEVHLALAELTTAQAQLVAAAKSPSVAPDKPDQSALEQLAQQLKADVLFRTASAELDASAITKLNELGAVLGSYTDLSIEVDGYADPRGKAPENMNLSQQRALAVRAALIVGGANPDNIRIMAHGERLSTATKNDMDAYAWERRATLSITTSISTSAPRVLAQAK